MDTPLIEPVAAASLRPLAATCAVRPAVPLRDYVSHYWLCRHTVQATHAILPDGAVDVVVALGADGAQIDVFGTTTARTEVALESGAHYLGIRFRPGQARHFVDVPAAALIDASLPAADALRWQLDRVADVLPHGDVFADLDAILLRQIERHPPRQLPLDLALRALEHGGLDVGAAARASGLGLRQFERRVFAGVGLPPKLFAAIARFQRASLWLARGDLSLAEIAARAGYADQSHLTRAFVRFAGQPPARARRDVAFVQDATRPPVDTAVSFNEAME